jgi:hypothetical protein
LDAAVLGFTATALLAYAGFAFAYRPFDSTDADVAKAGEVELELGLVHWLRQNGKRFLQVPAVVANFGFERERELVIEGRHEVALDPEPDEHRSALVDNGVFIKQVLRRGALQDEPGLSVATEYGVLLPDVHGEHGTGASVSLDKRLSHDETCSRGYRDGDERGLRGRGHRSGAGEGRPGKRAARNVRGARVWRWRSLRVSISRRWNLLGDGDDEGGAGQMASQRPRDLLDLDTAARPRGVLRRSQERR